MLQSLEDVLPPNSTDQYNSLFSCQYNELKQMLREISLPVKGDKRELVVRLIRGLAGLPLLEKDKAPERRTSKGGSARVAAEGDLAKKPPSACEDVGEIGQQAKGSDEPTADDGLETAGVDNNKQTKRKSPKEKAKAKAKAKVAKGKDDATQVEGTKRTSDDEHENGAHESADKGKENEGSTQNVDAEKAEQGTITNIDKVKHDDVCLTMEGEGKGICAEGVADAEGTRHAVGEVDTEVCGGGAEETNADTKLDKKRKKEKKDKTEEEKRAKKEKKIAKKKSREEWDNEEGWEWDEAAQQWYLPPCDGAQKEDKPDEEHTISPQASERTPAPDMVSITDQEMPREVEGISAKESNVDSAPALETDVKESVASTDKHEELVGEEGGSRMKEDGAGETEQLVGPGAYVVLLAPRAVSELQIAGGEWLRHFEDIANVDLEVSEDPLWVPKEEMLQYQFDDDDLPPLNPGTVPMQAAAQELRAGLHVRVVGIEACCDILGKLQLDPRFSHFGNGR